MTKIEFTPALPVSRDRIYPRCVYCQGENWAIAVWDYSHGDRPCAAVNGCGRYLPESHRRVRGSGDA